MRGAIATSVGRKLLLLLLLALLLVVDEKRFKVKEGECWSEGGLAAT